jgi:hypothetical protein
MNESHQFPDSMVVARERGEAFQRLTNDERVHALIDTIRAGMFLLRNSPNREAIDRLFHERERRWQEIQTEIFAEYARRTAVTGPRTD